MIEVDSSLMSEVDRSCVPEQKKDRDGRCYEIAGRFIMDNPDWFLVHATLYPKLGKFAGKPFPHAFTELGEIVFDPVFNKFYVKAAYYAIHNVTNARKYESMKALKLMLKTKHFGEWE